MNHPPALQFAQAFGHETSDKRLDILKRIGELGSISEAARSANVSYKAAWQALETLSNLAGAPLVDKAVGGSGGGGARLTPAGVQLLEAAELLRQARSHVLSTLAQRAGSSLKLSGLVGLGLRTSMRNQLPCEIQSVHSAAGTTRVVLSLTDDARWGARITHESAELLGLKAGMSALALCKATAVRIGTALAPVAGQNLLHGTVLTAAAAGAETSLALSPQLQLIGFAAAPLAEGQLAQAVVDEAAVVIAIPD
jgi:molybdate transport system regulatory protein